MGTAPVFSVLQFKNLCVPRVHVRVLQRMTLRYTAACFFDAEYVGVHVLYDGGDPTQLQLRMGKGYVQMYERIGLVPASDALADTFQRVRADG